MTRGLLFLLLCISSPLWGMPASEIAIAPGSSQDFEIPSATTQDFALRMPPGKISTVVFQQTESTIRVRTSEEISPTADAHFNLGGRLTSIVFHAAGLHAPADGLVLFLVENKTRRPAKFHLTVSSPRTPIPADSVVIQAEEDAAHALALAAAQAAESARQSLPLFASAEAKWRSLNEPAALAQILSVHLYTLAYSLNDQASALKQLPELIQLAQSLTTSQPAEAANAHKTAGFIYANQARYDETLKQYDQALSLFETTGDLFNRVVMLENRSKIERIQGDNARALADVDAALPLARQNRDARGEEALEVERGAIAYESGQLGPAYESDLKAITLAQPQPGFLEAEAWSDLALVYLDLHDYEQSSRALDRAEAIWKKSPNTYGQLDTRENRAELLLAQGDIPGARAVFEEGAKEAKDHGLIREHIAFLRGVSVCAMRAGKFADAETPLRQATQEAEQSQVGDELSALYAVAGDLNAAQDHWDTAAEAWRHADEAAQKRGHDLDRSIALGGLARAALHLDQLDDAHARCQQAMTAIESVRRQINDNDLRLSFFSSRHALYDLCVQIDMQRNDPESAFAAAERSRARTLLDQAVSSGIQPNIPEEFLARLTANQQALTEARKAMAQADRPSKNQPARSQTAKGKSRQPTGVKSTSRLAQSALPQYASMQAILEQRAALRQEAQQNGYDVALAAAAMPFTEREVAQRLDPDTALIAYWSGQDKSYVWFVAKAAVGTNAVPGAGVLVKPLPPAAALDTRVRQYLDLLSQSMPSAVTGSAADRAAAIARMQSRVASEGASLRRLLLPFAIPPAIKRLLLVKDGALLTLSFAVLPAAPSTYLATRYELASEPSAAFAFRQPRSSDSTKVVAFIDPSSSNDQPSGAQRRADLPVTPGADFASWASPLPYARDEAQVLQDTFGPGNATIFTGPAATRAQALSTDWSVYSLAHFAAHAVYRKAHPELSGIVLSPAAAPQKSAEEPPAADLLSFSDVLRIKSPPPLVVLSACSSSIGSFVPGEGMLALDTAFLASGSSQVISTLWPVDDQASSIFMREFYRAFAATHSALQSIHKAQKYMASSREWSAPYYWGAFTLSGDWRGAAPSATQP